MALALENPNLLSLAAGFTDNATLPVAAVETAVKTLAAEAADPEYLQYGSNHGRPGLRRLIAERLVRLEPTLESSEVQRGLFVTNGSQQALYLAAQVLCEPGDIVLVDRPSYFVFLEMLQGLGIEAVSIPLDKAGRVDEGALAELLTGLRLAGRADRVKAVYFVSYFSNPSGRSLTTEEKAVIGRTLSAADMVIPVIEDAAYRELYYESPWPAMSVLSLPEWRTFPKLYTATLTKPFATGLKVGFGVCTDIEWRAKMLHVKAHHDFGTANFNQALCEQVMASGAFDSQLERLRPAYAVKMRVLDAALREGGLPELGWQWLVPTGGLYLWLTAPAGLDTGIDGAFCRECATAGVLYVPGALCYGDAPPVNTIRLSFGVLSAANLREAGRRFITVARRFSTVQA